MNSSWLSVGRPLWTAAVLAIGLTLASPAQARYKKSQFRGADKSTGVGIMFGEPTGLTIKHWVDDYHAVDFGLAFSLNDFLLIQSDYLWHFEGLFGHGNPFVDRLEPYLGLGGVLFISTQSHRTDAKFFTQDGSVGFGARVPIGVEWLLLEIPLGVFVEIVPGLGFIPSTFGFFQGDVGARFYF